LKNRYPRIRWYREDRGDDKRLWEENWEKTDWTNSPPDMKYFAEFPYCLSYLSDLKGYVLDAGCGPGHYVKALQGKNVKVVGLDFSYETLRAVRRSNLTLSLQVGDVRFLPYKDEVFDGVMHFGVAEHFEEGPERCIRKAHRVLRKGGYLLLSVPYLNIVCKCSYPFLQLMENLSKNKRHMKFYQYIFTRSELIDLLRKAGFKVIDSERIYYTTVVERNRFLSALRNLILALRKRSSGSHPGPWSRTYSMCPARSSLKEAIIKTLNYMIAHFIILVATKE